MGTLIALNHPRAAQRDVPHFPYMARIRSEGATFTTLLSSIPAQYEPAAGQAPDTFEGEAPAHDRVLLQRAHDGTIKAKGQQLVLISPGGAVRYFNIHDVVEADSYGRATLLTVSPWKANR